VIELGNNAEKRLVLAFDTASDAIALAIGELRITGSTQTITPLASRDMMARREANIKLVPAIDKLFHQSGLNKRDLSCVVCGRGPGSFTGVRIAVATAKGIAAGLKTPLYGVLTPDAQAWQAWQAGVRGQLAVLSDAMRGEVYPACYNLDKNGVQRTCPVTVIKSHELAQQWKTSQLEGTLLLTGDALHKYSELFSAYTWLDEQYWHPQGEGLLMAFEVLDSAVESSSIAALLPLYTRLSDAEENERKRLAAGGETRQGALTELPASGVSWPLQAGQSIFRPAARGDITALVELEESAYNQANSVLSGECWTEAMYLDELRKITEKNRSWWVCYQDNLLVGFAGGQLIDGCLHILDVVVRESHQRRGIARQLIQHLIEDARVLGASELTLEVRASNKPAQALYEKTGFREVGRRVRYYLPQQSDECREDALIMTRELGQETEGAGADLPVFQKADKTTPAPSVSSPLILAIESSCDETAVALIDGKGQLLSNVIASQVDFHARFGGVVPEIASRKHTEAIYPTVMEAMGVRNWEDLDAIAVTYAPGLVGALVVGMAFAKGLSWSTDTPLIKVNHLEGHIYANRFEEPEGDKRARLAQGDKAIALPHFDENALHPPYVIALLSGGNTMLVSVLNWGEYKILGETLDDAVGEAYDKVAKALGLGYPGGPIIAQLATEGNPEAIAFPRALLHSGDYRFSLSGLKTAVLTAIRQQEAAGTLNPANIAASFEQAVIEVQVAKALKACESLGVNTFCLGGGVAANKALRNAYQEALEPRGIRVKFPPVLACTDNAAMIAAVALDRFAQKKFANLSDDAAAQSCVENAY